MSDQKFIIIARQLNAAKSRNTKSVSLSEDEALRAAIEIVEALADEGLCAEDFLDDAFDLHPLSQVPAGATIH